MPSEIKYHTFIIQILLNIKSFIPVSFLDVSQIDHLSSCYLEARSTSQNMPVLGLFFQDSGSNNISASATIYNVVCL